MIPEQPPIKDTTNQKLRYKSIFKQLDIHNEGKFDYSTLRKAFQDSNHPLKSNDEAIRFLFTAMDSNNDNVVDYNDFMKYVTVAESQIEEGFQNIDLDHDGKIKPSDVSNYLSKLDIKNADIGNKSSAAAASPNTYNIKNSPSRFNNFIHWAFYKKLESNDNIENKEEVSCTGDNSIRFEDRDQLYITYNQWRDFLLLMPREGGSRLKTAYSYFYLFNEDVELSSEGDMTLINDFVKGFGYFIAGGLSGVISRTATAPFDRIKVFLIARTDLSSTLLNSKATVLAKNPKANLNKLRSPITKAITTLYRQGGVRAFYVGNGLSVFKVCPESSIKFGTFELVKRAMSNFNGNKNVDDLSRFHTYIAGGLAGMVSQISIYPIDTLKFRIQCAPLDCKLKGNQLLFATASNMYKEGGLGMFYKGAIVGAVGIFPYAALDLGTFSALKKWYIKRKSKSLNVPEDKVDLSYLQVLPMGAISGSVGATAVYPINLLRTRLQTQATFAHPYLYTGFRDVFTKTIQREGIPGLYKGLVPTLAKVCPAVSIGYLCYENFKKLMKLN
ncbi:Ca(2+)-binding ATP:ADP antiporter SAL1 NDAI_0F02520 [Naumovozyma dairenensis CBS 421]|uniref:EF-hand domain-containing protein n=1 Tax=Naumovozyma dairenensis (strain ATCC 10597 / BCRC 20456 / CBS 421 / NBRC 0211 / NRRL Y-12639) TaxID=1071378 RepID=G0WCQ9_NAUDC|nr:hypothetical protein NDAI_0F02520 [Naumovozyma dairenensis CBS 421]CCD25570.1 hypothetical protein NDAI_0F02520 [Naumovozyma dairenensis CBS 421]